MKRLVQLDANDGPFTDPPPWRCEQCLRHAKIDFDTDTPVHALDGSPICDYTYEAAATQRLYQVIAP